MGNVLYLNTLQLTLCKSLCIKNNFHKYLVTSLIGKKRKELFILFFDFNENLSLACPQNDGSTLV